MARTNATIGPTHSIRFPNGTILRAASAASATQFTNDGGRLRSAALPSEIDTSPAFEKAMRDVGVVEVETIHLDVDPTLSTAASDAVVLQPALPASAQDARAVVLYQDESGGLSWHFAEAEPEVGNVSARARPGLRMSGGHPRFVIPLRTNPSRAAMRSERTTTRLRGPITKWGRKIFKVLVMPILAEVLNAPLEAIVGAAERRNRVDRVWRLTPDTYTKPPQPQDEFHDWGTLDGKPSLLVIHGIFSSVEGMLASLPRNAMDVLADKYQGRVLGFNHLSVSKSPDENARYFLETAKTALPGGKFNFDVLVHSRGGIVARALTERGPQLFEGNCNFRKVFFVASPNNGSALGDPRHMVDMIDVFTNLLTLFPDGPVLYSIEVLLAIVKLLAYTFETSLPGLAAMGTETYIPKVLNAGTSDRPKEWYAAAASNYAPDASADNGFITGPFATQVIDRVFRTEAGDTANDLVVPQQGVYGANGHPLFPIADPLLLNASDHVWHGGFFARSNVLARINRHFEIAPAVVRPAAPPLMVRRPALRSGYGGSGIAPPVPAAAAAVNELFEAAAEPAQLMRQPSIDFPRVVSEGETHELTVVLAEPPQGLAGALVIPLEPGQTSVDLGITIAAPGFSVTPRERSMIIHQPRNAATERVTFTLLARTPGPVPLQREIRVDFWLDNSCIGGAAHPVIVMPKGFVGVIPDAQASLPGSLRLPRVQRDDCDLAIRVLHEPRKGADAYSVELRSRVPGRSYESKAAGTLWLNGQSVTTYVSDLLDPQFAKYPLDPQMQMSDAQYAAALQAWNTEFGAQLKALGRQLWLQLPEAFRNEYFELLAAEYPPRAIAIYSDEMTFPWELVIPWSEENVEERPSLGVAHILGRWQPSLGLRPDPQKFQLRTLVVVNPRYQKDDLAWSEQEIADLQKIVPEFSVTKPCDTATVQKLLERRDIQLLHFSGHGIWSQGGNADLTALQLEDGALPAVSLVGRQIGRGKPILYLNACTVGRAGQVLGRSGGFARNCIASGWTGIIAPYWPINDASARDFSAAFYSRLKAGRSIGEALQELRAERPNDPTYQAYAYIGDPMARVLFPS
jgi:pimeloyl-ACP methyl ester carboxylesterase